MESTQTLPDGTVEIAPRTGTSFILNKGQRLTVIDPRGVQVSDLIAFNRHDPDEVISNGRTLDYASRIYLTTGDPLYSNRSNVMLKIVEDTCGRHDFLLTPCSKDTFRIIYGDKEPHQGCFGNLANAISKHGISEDRIPCAFNCFMNVPIDSKTGELKVDPPISKAGDHIDFVAEMDLIIGMTACSALQSNGGSFKPIQYRITGQLAEFCLTRPAIVAAVPSVIAVYFGRFFQGVAAAIPATVAFGNFEDMFDAESRIWIVYGYTLSGMIGLALGPIYSSYITEVIGWRWVFYISTIVAGVSAILCIFIKESKATQLLEGKVKDLRKDTGRSNLFADGSDEHMTLSSFAQTSLFRPLKLLFTEPIVFFCSILCAIAFGLIYGLTEGLTVTYTNPPFDKTFTQTSSSLSFIAILIGEILNILPRFYDQHIFRKYRHEHRRILPESKIGSFAIACPVLAIGLWIFAWTVPPIITTVPWPVSMIGLICIGFALNDFSYVLFGYVTDSYGEYAASAVAALSLTRTLAAGVFPLFSYQMFSGLGSNVAATILAAVATLFAFTPLLFLKYGGKMRTKSKVASNDEDCLVEENKHMEDGKDDEKSSEEEESV